MNTRTYRYIWLILSIIILPNTSLFPTIKQKIGTQPPFTKKPNIDPLIADPVTPVLYSKGVFCSTASKPTLFLCASSTPDDIKKYSFSQAIFNTSTSNGLIEVKGLAGTGDLSGKIVARLALWNNTTPLIALADKPNVYFALSNDASNFGTHEKELLIDAEKIKGVAALAGGHEVAKDGIDKVFAAVHALDGGWDDATKGADGLRGISILVRTQDGKKLEALDALNLATKGENAKAFKFDVTARSDEPIPTLEITTGATTTPAKEKKLSTFNLEDTRITKKLSKCIAFYNQNIAENTEKSFHIQVAELGPDVEMYWDQPFERLYVGLSDVRRDDPTKEGGLCSILVGHKIKCQRKNGVQLEAFYFLPVYYGYNEANARQATPKQNHFLLDKSLTYKTDDTNNKNITTLIGTFYGDGTTTDGRKDVHISTRKIRTLHTSTGKDYLIVHNTTTCGAKTAGSLVIPDVIDGICALPLLTKAPAILSAKNTRHDDDFKGTVSGVTTSTGIAKWAPPTSVTDMPRVTDLAVAVGGLKNPAGIETTDGTTFTDRFNPFDNSFIKDMFIVGDAVYVCLAGYKGQDTGIFMSAALFDGNGNIMGWTPWQRVMGNLERIFGGGMDAKTGNFYFLSSESNDSTAIGDKYYLADTVAATHWGKGDNSTQDKKLSTVLSTLLGQANGGINNIVNFDEYTGGFALGRFSMMLALGYDSLALVVTGEWKNGAFVPVKDFVSGTNVFSIANNPVLRDIAPITTAETARTQADNSGWFFVGGYKGVAVYSKTADGSGWESQTGLTVDLIKNNGSNFSFKKLTLTGGEALTDVRKLISNGSSLMIFTATKCYSIKFSADNFKTGTIGKDDTTGWRELTITLPVGAAYTDAVFVGNNRYVIATTKGILIWDNSTPAIPTTTVISSISPVLSLTYLSTVKENGWAGQKGNVYALVASFICNSGEIYRFTVDSTARLPKDVLKPIDGENKSCINLKEFRGKFTTDGSMGISLTSKDFNQEDLVRLYSLVQASKATTVTKYLDINLETNYKTGLAVANSAAGAWIVPGDWGIRINE